VVQLLAKVEQLEKRIDEIENRLNQGSQNFYKPPCSDSPYKKPTKRVKKKDANTVAKRVTKAISKHCLHQGWW
jgi:cell division septum initiation protein DivIVA